jgi:hypothetical protein
MSKISRFKNPRIYLFERKRRRKLQSNFRRSWSEFIIVRIPMTENGTFFGTKSGFFGTRNMTTLETLFSLGNHFFLFHNFNTATHGGRKNQNFDLLF